MTVSKALEVKDLTISVGAPGGGRAIVVDGASFEVEYSGTVGIVGESGSGKTMTSLAILGLLPPGARVEGGSILFEGRDLVKASDGEMRKLRGSRISMVLQDPMTALDPSFTIRSQLSEPLEQHRRLSGRELAVAMVDALERVQLSAARERLNQYPHQLSGGMRQRVTSAIALAGEPRLLIADEPTTALDVTTQARYLSMLGQLQESTNFALILIAHDLMVVRDVCRRVVVMYAGQVVEQGAVHEVFAAPQHPYTQALLAAVPTLSRRMRLQAIEGTAPDPTEVIVGCQFAARCPHAREICSLVAPELTARAGDDRAARCWGTEPGGWISTPGPSL